MAAKSALPVVLSVSVTTSCWCIGAQLALEWRKRNTVPGGRVPESQVAALRDLFDATGGATSWIRNENWMTSTDPCDPLAPWWGVSCTNVTERTLPSLYNTTSARGVTVNMHAVFQRERR